jgi:Dinucleotide-utilizing enzymes involved in molybdopterin and thiamine biosynthesis family 2
VRAREYDQDRFDRMRRIEWMDVESIRKARCLVVGAGALGNEAVKCMVLAGFGDITVIDMDEVAVSNLSRCVFFREKDGKGTKKAEILAERASELYDGVKVKGMVSKIQDLESWDFNIVLGCLDNILARLHVNSHSRFNGIPYVDGATDGFRGKVQVVLPEGPCLECGMNKSHMRVLDTRFSCTGSGMLFVPKVASEITTTSVIAAIQVRESMKILSGRKDLCIRNVMFYDGETGTSENLELSEDPGCPNHEVGVRR